MGVVLGFGRLRGRVWTVWNLYILVALYHSPQTVYRELFGPDASSFIPKVLFGNDTENRTAHIVRKIYGQMSETWRNNYGVQRVW